MRAPHREEGQIIVLFALMFVVLVLAAGLVLDGSFAWVKQREAQNAADFAAIAGANSLRAGNVSDEAILATVNAVAQDNGATVQTAEYTDRSGNPYTPAKNVGSQSDLTLFGGVKVVAARGWTPFFPVLWGGATAQAGASGTARFIMAPGSGSGPCALCALDFSKVTPALNLGSNSGIAIATGNVVTNGGITATSGAALNLAGTGATVTYYGTSNVSAGTVSPSPTLMSAPVTDPYAFLADPVASGPTFAAVNQSDKKNPMTLNPGIYPSFTVGSGASLTLNPGTYYISDTGPTAGTGLACGSGSTFTALGVTMVFLGQAPFAPGSGCTLNLSAPDPKLTPTPAIPYPGLLIYFARTNTSGLTMWSGSGTTISGSIYARSASLTVQGGSVTGTAIQSMIVVDNIQVKASSFLTTSFDSSKNVILPNAKLKVALVQ